MKYLKQFGIILAFSFLGEILNYILPLPVPASIYGIVLLFFTLLTGLLHIEDVSETGYFLIEIMPIMFVPAAVGLITSWEIIRPAWLQYLAVTFISTVIVMAITGRITQTVLTRTSNHKETEDNHHDIS